MGPPSKFPDNSFASRSACFAERRYLHLLQTVYSRLTISGEFGHVFSWRHPPSPNAFGGSLSPASFLSGAGFCAIVWRGVRAFHSSGRYSGGFSAPGAICLLNRQAALAIPPSSSCSAIAQLVEQATVNRPVAGSSPARGATLFPSRHIRRVTLLAVTIRLRPDGAASSRYLPTGRISGRRLSACRHC